MGRVSSEQEVPERGMEGRIIAGQVVIIAPAAAGSGLALAAHQPLAAFYGAIVVLLAGAQILAQVSIRRYRLANRALMSALVTARTALGRSSEG